MNADEMMYELGFKECVKDIGEDKMMYYFLTENDHWIVRFFKSYGIVSYLVSHTHWFETDREWKKMDPIVDMDLHKVIHQVLLEHGWL